MKMCDERRKYGSCLAQDEVSKRMKANKHFANANVCATSSAKS